MRKVVRGLCPRRLLHNQAGLPRVRASLRPRAFRSDPLPLVLHRPSIEAFWQARWGVTTFSPPQLQDILSVTEFSYEDLLKPFVLFAPLYAELENKARQRMIVRTWYKEALASFVRAGLGPTSTLGPQATRSVAWICAFSAGVINEIPSAQQRFCDFPAFLQYLNQIVREERGTNMDRV
jgi:hypothetical protein